MTLEQQPSLFGLGERERAEGVLGSEAALEKGRAAASTPHCSFKDPHLWNPQFPICKAGLIRPQDTSRAGREGKITEELEPLQTQARPVSAEEPCFHCLASHVDCFFKAAGDVGWGC